MKVLHKINPWITAGHYLGGLFLAGIAAFQLYTLLPQEVSLYARLLKGFDYLIFGELLQQINDQLGNVYAIVLCLAIIKSGFELLFSGGIVDSVLSGKLQIQRFLIFTRKFLFTHFLLGLLLYLALGIWVGLFMLVSIKLQQTLEITTYKQQILLHIPTLLFIAFGIILRKLLWDYIRSFSYIHPYKSVLFHLKLSFKTLFGQWKPWIYGAQLALISLGLSALIFALSTYISESHLLSILLLFLIKQGLLMAQSWVRLNHMILSYELSK